jgi:cytokinesis protein
MNSGNILVILCHCDISCSKQDLFYSWYQKFLSLSGTLVLAQSLQHISRTGSSRSVHSQIQSTSEITVFGRRDADIQLEYEIVKCLKQILNQKVNSVPILSNAILITQCRLVKCKRGIITLRHCTSNSFGS